MQHRFGGSRGAGCWKHAIVAGAVTLLLGGGGLLVGLVWRPAWYRPAAVDYGRLREDKAALVALEEEISAALNAGRSIRVEIRAEQLNRWLAARHEIWPNLIAELADLEDPVAEIGAGTVRLGVLWKRGHWRAVLSVQAEVLETRDELAVRCDAPRVGAVPIPRDWVAGIPPAMGATWDTSGVLRIPNCWIWPNGRRACRLTALECRPGVVMVELGPHPQ